MQREAVEKMIANLNEDKWWEETVRARGQRYTPQLHAPVEECLRVLDPGNDRHGRCAPKVDDIDQMTQEALLLNHSGEYDALIIAACAAYSRCDRIGSEQITAATTTLDPCRILSGRSA